MDQEKWNKVARGAFIAVLGALLSYSAVSVVPLLHDHAGVAGPALAALASTLINLARKYVESISEQKETPQ